VFEAYHYRAAVVGVSDLGREGVLGQIPHFGVDAGLPSRTQPAPEDYIRGVKTAERVCNGWVHKTPAFAGRDELPEQV
jgi:hypothetical protein